MKSPDVRKSPAKKGRIRKENNNKVTTLFIDKAEPIVKRYDFIKGFEGGKLDFYSTEKNKPPNIPKTKHSKSFNLEFSSGNVGLSII